MQSSTSRALLFGGALLSAGIADTAEAVGTFDVSAGAYAQPILLFASRYDYDSGSFDSASSTTFDTVGVSNAYYDISASLTPTSMSVSSIVDPLPEPHYNYWAAEIRMYIDVTEDLQVEASWGGFGSEGPGGVRITRAIGGGAFELYYQSTGGVNTETFTLFAGETYYVYVTAVIFPNPVPAGWTAGKTASLTIVPSPWTATPLGICGIAAMTRRRRPAA